MGAGETRQGARTGGVGAPRGGGGGGDAVTAALGDLGVRGLGAIAFEALEAELPLLRDEPDLAEAAPASVLANVGLVLDTARGAASLAALEPPPAAVAFPRELARRNVPV